jgi:hypothetical protein
MKKLLVGLLILAVLAVPVVSSHKSNIKLMSGDPYDAFMVLK